MNMPQSHSFLNEMLTESLQDLEFNALWTTHELYREVALALIRYRSQKGMSQRQVAKQMGLSILAIMRMESLEFERVTMAAYQKVADALGLQIKAVFKQVS